MPLYDYQCPNCWHMFELRQSFNSDPCAPCPRCRSVSRRKFHAVPVIYKGSGFYTTDYKRNGHNGASAPNGRAGEKEAGSLAAAAASAS